MTDVLFPLTPGRAWIYRVRDFDGRVSQFEARVKEAVELDGDGGKLTLVEESGGYPGEKQLDTSRDLVAYYARGGLIFRIPWTSRLEIGVDAVRLADGGDPVLAEDPRRQPSWHGHFSVLAGEGAPMAEVDSDGRALDSPETVVVPAGTFRRCVRVETTASALAPGRSGSRMIRHYYTEWYAPGVGLVKARTAVDAGGRRVDVLTADLASVDPPPND